MALLLAPPAVYLDEPTAADGDAHLFSFLFITFLEILFKCALYFDGNSNQNKHPPI